MRVPDHMVELKVPVDGTYVSVVRLLVSGLATRLGLAVDDIEDLKLVVGESFLAVVAKSAGPAGLVTLKWNQTQDRVNVRISDPTGKHKELINSANLALLKRLGGEYNTAVVDGHPALDLDFEIKYRDNRPFLFNERPDGRA
jgi:serine/threonine-protein kinase RsbW